MMPGHDPKALVQRLWDFCDVLRDDGLSYGDYLEQLTYLLFLKMSDEQHELLGGQRVVPIEYDWQSLLSRSGAALEAHYSEILSELGAGDDMLGVVFRKARNRIQTPAKLEQFDQGLHRQARVAQLRRRPQGRRLRGPDREDRPGGRPGSGPILHAAGAHLRHRRRDAPPTGPSHL